MGFLVDSDLGAVSGVRGGLKHGFSLLLAASAGLARAPEPGTRRSRAISLGVSSRSIRTRIRQCTAKAVSRRAERLAACWPPGGPTGRRGMSAATRTSPTTWAAKVHPRAVTGALRRRPPRVGARGPARDRRAPARLPPGERSGNAVALGSESGRPAAVHRHADPSPGRSVPSSSLTSLVAITPPLERLGRPARRLGTCGLAVVRIRWRHLFHDDAAGHERVNGAVVVDCARAGEGMSVGLATPQHL
jgi:hypothetical protein